MAERHYWVNTVSRDHVRAGVSGGFTQADHGNNMRLKRFQQGDYLVFYSPRTHVHSGETLQAFTALGRITDLEPYQVEMSPNFHPWRRNVKFLDSHEAPVRPLIEHLSFITNKDRWGFPFRRGLFEVSKDDFDRIAAAMGVTLTPV